MESANSNPRSHTLHTFDNFGINGRIESVMDRVTSSDK